MTERYFLVTAHKNNEGVHLPCANAAMAVQLVAALEAEGFDADYITSGYKIFTDVADALESARIACRER